MNGMELETPTAKPRSPTCLKVTKSTFNDIISFLSNVGNMKGSCPRDKIKEDFKLLNHGV